MKKLRLLPLFLLILLCLGSTALAASIPGQQSISSIADANGYVSSLTDDDATTSWIKSGNDGADLTISLYSGSVGEIWIRNGYAYTQNWYNHYDRPAQVKVTVYYYANQYTTSYDTFRYTLTDAFRPNTVSGSWNSGYQRLLLPKKYTGVTKIELTVESVIAGYGQTGAAISDIIIASGSHATATPKAYATATPKPYVVYITPTPAPETEEDDYPYVEYITPDPWEEEDYTDVITPESTRDSTVTVITPKPTATPYVQLITPTPEPYDYPSEEGAIGYSNQRLPTRSGPGTGYDEPGSFYTAGHQVKVVSKMWDSTNRLYWYQFEIMIDGEWYRLYTTDSRIDVDASDVPEEPALGDPLDTRKSLGEHEIYYGPGEDYARVEDAMMVEGKRCDVYMIEDDWALVDYYDYGRDIQRRGWIPVNLLYAN